MNKDILKKVLDTSSIEFSYEEIQNLLDEELEKEPEEMDTELIELCIDVLSQNISSNGGDNIEAETEKEVSAPQNDKAHKKRSVKKVFLIAAIVALISLITISVSANVSKLDLPAGMLRIGKDRILIDLTMLENTLPEADIEGYYVQDVILLPAFSEAECELMPISTNETDNILKFSFEFDDSGIKGSISIRDYNEFNTLLKYSTIYMDIEQIKQMSINGIDVIVMSSTDSYVTVLYILNNRYYSINFVDVHFDDVVKLLEYS